VNQLSSHITFIENQEKSKKLNEKIVSLKESTSKKIKAIKVQKEETEL